MRRGSVSERFIKCGKAGCACARDPKARHGPYQSLTQAVGGKTRSRFLTPEQTAVAQQQVAAGRQFRQKVDSYWEACEEWADAQMEFPPAASSGEAKKKGSKQKSKTILPLSPACWENNHLRMASASPLGFRCCLNPKCHIFGASR